YGTEEQKRHFLPRIAAGELYWAIGMSEPDAGSDLASVRTRAERVDGGWRVTGTKVWTSGAHHAHAFFALARTAPADPGARHAGLSQFIVDLRSDGVEIRPILSMTGSHHFNEVHLESVLVPDSGVLGTIGEGWQQVTSELSYERSGPERFLSTWRLLAGLAGAGDPGAGRLLARVTALHHMSSSVAEALEAHEDVSAKAAVVKVLGTTLEGDVAEVADLTGSMDPEMRALTAQALAQRPGFTLRGGTNEVLKGVIARELGLR
ncbi:acyl-CoA dehydrogenase family protein, partial [Streptomyces sp. NPDC002920]